MHILNVNISFNSNGVRPDKRQVTAAIPAASPKTHWFGKTLISDQANDEADTAYPGISRFFTYLVIRAEYGINAGAVGEFLSKG